MKKTMSVEEQNEYVKKLIEDKDKILKALDPDEPQMEEVPCNNCQGGGCTTCGGYGYWLQRASGQTGT